MRHPGDVSGLARLIDDGEVEAGRILAVLGTRDLTAAATSRSSPKWIYRILCEAFFVSVSILRATLP